MLSLNKCENSKTEIVLSRKTVNFRERCTRPVVFVFYINLVILFDITKLIKPRTKLEIETFCIFLYYNKQLLEKWKKVVRKSTILLDRIDKHSFENFSFVVEFSNMKYERVRGLKICLRKGLMDRRVPMAIRAIGQDSPPLERRGGPGTALLRSVLRV